MSLSSDGRVRQNHNYSTDALGSCARYQTVYRYVFAGMGIGRVTILLFSHISLHCYLKKNIVLFAVAVADCVNFTASCSVFWYKYRSVAGCQTSRRLRLAVWTRSDSPRRAGRGLQRAGRLRSYPARPGAARRPANSD